MTRIEVQNWMEFEMNRKLEELHKRDFFDDAETIAIKNSIEVNKGNIFKLDQLDDSLNRFYNIVTMED